MSIIIIQTYAYEQNYIRNILYLLQESIMLNEDSQLNVYIFKLY